MQALALIVVAAAGLWLVGVAFLMALRPRYCLHLFETMSANLERTGHTAAAGLRGCRLALGCHLAADHGRPDPVAWYLRDVVGEAAYAAAVGAGLLYAAL
jgi:hypothetical protein